MRRYLFWAIGFILVSGLLTWWFWPRREPPRLDFADSSLRTFSIEGIEYNSKREAFSRTRMIQIRASAVNNPIIVYGKVSPATAVIEGEITLEIAVEIEGKGGKPHRMSFHPELDPKRPGWWQFTIPSEPPGPLAINQVYPLIAVYKNTKEGILVDGLLTRVDTKQIAVASK